MSQSVDRRTQNFADELDDARKVNAGIRRMLEALAPPRFAPLMPDLRFLEIDFLKPTAKNPRIRNA